MKFLPLNPDYAYIGTNLFLPRKHFAAEPVKGALTFAVGLDTRVLVTEHPDHLEVPRAFLSVAEIEAIGVKVLDLRPTTYKSINLKPKEGFELRPRQNPAWAVLGPATGGVLNVGCGGGKTIMGLYKMADKSVQSLVIAEQSAHLDNWVNELREFFDFKGTIGRVGDGKYEWDADIVFATLKTVLMHAADGRLPLDWPSKFGLVLYDEVHHTSAKQYATALDIFFGDRIGLTATVKRVDRGEGIFLAHVGQVMFRDLATDLTPVVEILETEITVPEDQLCEIKDVGGNVHMGMLRNWLGRNEDRNALIRARIDQLVTEGEVLYALSHSVAHVNLLHDAYPGSGCMTGEETKGRLAQLNGRQIVFATVQVAKENYNRKDLSTLLMLTPFGAAAHADAPTLTQAIGRIQRNCEGKKGARVILVFDKNIPEATGMGFGVINYLKSQGFPIEGAKWRKKISDRALAHRK